MGLDQVLQTILFCLVLGSYYTLIASGFTLVFGISRIFNFAHGELYMFGGFFLYYLIGMWSVNYFVALIVCGLAVGVMGVVLERLFYRPGLRPSPGRYACRRRSVCRGSAWRSSLAALS